MPIDEQILINIEANTQDAASGIEEVILELGRLNRSLKEVDNAETARRRHLEANARARQEKYRMERAEIEKVAKEINAAAAADIARRRHLQANAKAREQRYRKERSEIEKVIAQIKQTTTADTNRTKRFVASERTVQAQLRTTTALINNQSTRMRAQASIVGSFSRAYVAAERTKQTEIKKTTEAAKNRNRLELEGLKEINREKARQFRRDERKERERFQRQQNYFGGAALGASFGAGLFTKFQEIAGQVAAVGAGVYVLGSAIGSIVRDRARVQRLEVGVRDLTDAGRAQAVLPRLQEIALLPGLDYVTATQAFTRALSGGFTDQQSLRLINQIRNAVALSQGSIEDTNEVLRQFIQIQARDRFDQENLRPILERAPFIRRVIQAEFGTQIGGEIQQVIESRGMTTTEGILRIVEGLAEGPVADPTTLQNALDNVGNELILFRNELGRRIQPLLSDLVDGFTEFLRFLQGGPGAVGSGALAGAIGFGTIGLLGDFAFGAARGRRKNLLSNIGYNRLVRQSYPVLGRNYRNLGNIGSPNMSDIFFGTRFVDEPDFAEENIRTTRKQLQAIHARTLTIEAANQNISRADARARAIGEVGDLTSQQRFVRDALFLGPTGLVDRRARRRASWWGRQGPSGLRTPFFVDRPFRFQNPFGFGFQSPFGGERSRRNPFGVRSPFTGRFSPRSPVARTGAGFGGLRQGLAIGTPGLIAAGAAILGGIQLGETAFETVARGGVEEAKFLGIDFAGIINAFNNIIVAGTGLSDNLIKLNFQLKGITEGGLPNFEALLGDIASRQAAITRRFGEVLGVNADAGKLITNNPLLAEVISGGYPTDPLTDPGSFARFGGHRIGIGSLQGASAERRKEALELLRAIREFEDVLNQATDTAATERGQVLARIRGLQSRRTTEQLGLTSRTLRNRRGEEYQVVDTVANKERLEAIKQINKELAKQFKALAKIDDQEGRIINSAERLLEKQDAISEKTFLYLKNLEDFTGNIDQVAPGVEALQKAFPKEQLDALNEMLQLGGHAAVTYGELAKTLREISMEFGNITDRKIITGLGEIKDSFGQLLPAMRELVSGIISPGDVDYRSGRRRMLGLPSERPNVTGLGRRGGDLGFAPIDIFSGVRQIRRTPGGLAGPLIGGEEARRAAFGAVGDYFSAQRAIQAGAPFDPRNPTTIRGTGPGPNIDPVTLDRFRKLNDEWQELLQTLNQFDRARGILDRLNVAPFRGGRIREIADLIVQVSKLRKQFIDLRDARIKAIEESGADDRLKRRLIGLINVPVEELTRKLRELSKEITQLTAQGLAVQTFKDQLNKLTASLLGRRGADTGIRAFGRQLGEFFGQYTVPRGREIIRQRREAFQREQEDLRRTQDEEIRERARTLRGLQEERARVFESYFAGTAESLYDEFIAPSILDAVGIGSGQGAARTRAFDRLKEDIQRQKESVRENDRLNARQQAEQMLEIEREYQREKREIERSYEEQRSDAWKNWVRQQLADFPKLIVQQLNLQLAARSTNFILNTLGIGGNIPITGPGINPLSLGQGVTQYAQQIGPGLRGSPGGPGTRGGNAFTNILSRIFGGNGGSGGGSGLPGSGFIPLGTRAGGVQYAAPIGPGAPGSPPLFTNSGASAAGIGSSSATAAVAISTALAAHNIATGTVPQWNPHRQSLFDDFGSDLLASTGTRSFFENLIFHNARNDSMARAAGMQAKMKRQAATLGRESAADIVSNFKEGFEETTINNNEKVYVVPAETTFSMPIIIGDQETRQISYNMDQLMSEGRL